MDHGAIEPLFHTDGDRYVPTELTRSPWGPDSLHGGPVAALLAGLAERHELDVPVHLARTTFEILRPVPFEPLSAAVRTVRPGKKVQLIESVLTVAATEVEVCRAVTLRIRTSDVELPRSPVPDPPPPMPDTAPVGVASGAYRSFHKDGVEMRWVQGRFEDEGPAVVWIRLPGPVVDDEPPSAVQRVMAAADFGNGVSRELPFATAGGGYLFINPDLTVYLHRPPVGEWICLDARTHLSAVGTGLAESALSDDHGRVGRSVQSLLVDRL